MRYKMLTRVLILYVLFSTGIYAEMKVDDKAPPAELNTELKVGDEAPTFFVRDINEKNFFLSDTLKMQKPTVLDFFATWCVPCKKEMPSLDSLYQDKNFKNLQAFAVNMEQPNKLKTKKFFTDLNIQKLEIFFDQNLNFVKEFKLRGVPTTILINKKGEEFARIIGEVNFQDKKLLKWLLKYD